MIRPDLAEEELKTELQKFKNRVSELEAFHTERHAGAETLQQIEAEAILELFNDGILVLDRKSRVIDANQRLENILGYQRKEFIGKTALNTARLLTHKGLTIIWRNPLKKTVKNESIPYEIDVFKKDGGLITVQIVCQQLRANAKVVGRLVIMKDLTERRRVERESHDSQEVYRSLVSHIGIGLFRATPGGAGRFLEVNPAMEEITGYSREDLLKMNVEDLYVHPEERAEHIKEVLSGMPTRAREVGFKKKDGTEIIVRDKKVAVRGNDSKTLYLEGFIEDITGRKQTEEALKVSEENFRNSIDSSLMGIRIVDEKGYTLYTNQAFLDIFGYKDIDEVRASPPYENYTPQEYARHILRKEKQLRNEPTPDEVEVDIIRKDGTIRHLKVFRKEVVWGGKAQYQTLYDDISERKNAEKALVASEANFRNSLDGSLMGIRIVNADWHTLYVNKVFLDIFGFNNIDEVKRTSLQDYYTTEEHARYLQRKEKRERGESIPDNPAVEIVGKDGTIHIVKVYLKEVLWNGKQQRQLVYHDVTEQKQAQQKIEKSAQEWRTTFDSITDLISIQDKDNRIIRVNKAVADLLHTTPQELVGKFCREVMRANQECPTNCPHLLAINTGKPSSIETFNPNLGLHLQESASPLFNEKGEITGTVLVARDVTQQKRIEEQLILTDRLASIGELSSGIAHELNNPLTSVIGFSQLLMEGDVPDNMKEDLGTVYNEAQRAAAIVKNLLTFARKHAPVKQLSQVNTVIEDVLRLRAYEQKVNNIKVENNLATNLPEIMIDHFQMQQVFLNMVINAEFAMQEAHHGGKLVIITEKVDGVIRITISDDGAGITKENLKHIFDPFFTTKEVGKGTGLGLSICHGIVTEHSGQIYARSEEGQGATFVVELPLINEQ